MTKREKLILNLHLFDGGEGGDGGAAAGADGTAAAEQDVKSIKYGIQPEDMQEGPQAQGNEPETQVTADTKEERQAQFRQMMADYKDEFTDYFNQQFNRRHRDAETNRTQLEEYRKLDPILDMLRSKYGTEAGDYEALSRAIEDDDSYYEEEADELDMSVKQLKEMKRLQRENERFRAAQDAIDRSRRADQAASEWMRQAESLKGIYPDFDLAQELNPDNPTSAQFMGLLKNNVDVRTAYEVIHHDDILQGAMAYTAQQTQKRIVNSIRSNGVRPAENGTSAAATATLVKRDPSSFSKRDRNEIARRVEAGERVVL